MKSKDGERRVHFQRFFNTNHLCGKASNSTNALMVQPKNRV